MRALSRSLSTLTAVILLMAEDAHADEVADFVGAAPSGLPGIGRVGVASPRKPLVVTAAAGAGYGYTEGQPGESGAHHRGFGTLAVALQPLRFLAASLELDGRVDTHPADVLGTHTTALGEPRLAFRVADSISKSIAVGAELDWRVPGTDAPSIKPGASTFDGKILATFAPTSDFAVALNAGYRLDRSDDLVGSPLRLRRGDRIALGASAFDAVLLGVGTSKRVGSFELLGELTWDVLIGSNAPSAIESPLRLGLGTRYQATESLQAELRTEIALGERPGTEVFDPIAPVEPRVALIVGIRFSRGPKKPVDVPPPPSVGPVVPTPVVPTVATTGTVRGRVTGEKGEPLVNATVVLGDKSVQTGADGSFLLTDVPPGKASVSIKAAGYDERAIDVDVSAGAAALTPDVVVKHTITPGQLRGLVRAFSGKAIAAATIRVEPLGQETKTDADGVFLIDVPPGTYEVVVSAPGFAGQRRKMQVDENGVTILNADLRQQGP